MRQIVGLEKDLEQIWKLPPIGSYFIETEDTLTKEEKWKWNN